MSDLFGNQNVGFLMTQLISDRQAGANITDPDQTQGVQGRMVSVVKFVIFLNYYFLLCC